MIFQTMFVMPYSSHQDFLLDLFINSLKYLPLYMFYQNLSDHMQIYTHYSHPVASEYRDTPKDGIRQILHRKLLPESNPV